MAIQENDLNQSRQAQATQAPVSNTGEGQQQQRQQKRNFASLGNFEPIGSNIGSEAYIELKKQLGEILVADDVEFSILDMTKDIYPNLYYSGMIVAERAKANPGLIAYQILLMAGTADPIKPLVETINQTQVEITRLPSDAYDDRVRDIAKQVVSKAFPNAKNVLVSCTVVPEGFNVKDAAAIRRLAHNAGTATNTELIYRSNQHQPVNLSEMDNSAGLTVALQFTNQQINGADSEPVRSSVIADFSFRPNQRSSDRSLNNGSANQTISQVSGFIDAVYAPVAGAANINPWLAQQQGAMTPTQKYIPRFVITDINSRVLTPEMVLMAIATGFTLGDDSNWIQSFRPSNVQTGKVNLTDIGALNIDANILKDASGFGKEIDTTVQTFTLGELGALVAAMFRQELAVSLDVPDAGSQTWYTDLFVAASRGDNSAYNVIYNAANALTGGRFERHFGLGQPMFIDLGNRVHLGHWTDRSGEKRDIRDFDHLAVCNLVGKLNPSLIRDWSDTWTKTVQPLPIRLAARKRMIQSLSGETAVFTGWAERVTFSGNFMNALRASIRETGLPVNVTTPLASSDFNNQRGVASWAADAGLSAGQSFAPAFTNQAGNFGMNMNANGYRW